MNWKTLRHRNVLPLLGVMFSGGRFAMASEWMVNGNINQFIAAQGGANRFELVGLRLLLPTPLCLHCLATIAQRCCSGADVYAKRGDDTWGSQRRRFQTFKQPFCLLT